MAHLYASFSDASLAEKAAGALLDYGVSQEDISIVANDAYGRTRSTSATYDNVANAGDPATISDATDENYTNVGSHGNPVAAFGDRVASATSSFVGAPASAAMYSEAAIAQGPSVVGPAVAIKPDFVDDADPETSPQGLEAMAKTGLSTTTPEDAGEGAVKGTEIGLGLGILAGIAALLVPGVGLVLGGGALAAAVGGAALAAGAGAIAGGITGYLKDQGVPGDAAARYQGTVENGGAILNVNLPSGKVDQALAEQVLGKYRAEEVHSY